MTNIDLYKHLELLISIYNLLPQSSIIDRPIMILKHWLLWSDILLPFPFRIGFRLRLTRGLGKFYTLPVAYSINARVALSLNGDTH